MIPVVEAVPNFSEGRDSSLVGAIVDCIAAHDVEVLDWSSDPDHNRSVVTFIGSPTGVERASLAAARLAIDRIDLRGHRGVHPRVGALDVMPFVPLRGVSKEDVVALAHRVGRTISGWGVPVYFYGYASEPSGRGLAELRRGGFEALRDAGAAAPEADDFDGEWTGPHPTAGATCVGAREVLLAWNVFVRGVTLPEARAIAKSIRERDGGFAGLRALGLRLDEQGRTQISMNLEDPQRTSPLDVFDAIEGHVRRLGGSVEETEVIGMIPDTLVLPYTTGRLKLPDLGPARVLSHRVDAYVSARMGGRPAISDTAE